MCSGEWIGSSAVTSKDGENIGTIKQVALDLDSGCIAYAVLSVTGTMNYDTKVLAVPWSVFSFSPEERSFILDIPREKIENAPDYDSDKFPAGVNKRWLENMNRYYTPNY